MEQAVRIARALEPELWSKVDHVAEMIDPAAFAEWSWLSSVPGKQESLLTQAKYKQSAARHRAFEIMQYLGIAPKTTNWTAIFERMVIEDTDKPSEPDALPTTSETTHG